MDIFILWFIVWAAIQVAKAESTRMIILIVGIIIALSWFGWITVGHHPFIAVR